MACPRHWRRTCTPSPRKAFCLGCPWHHAGSRNRKRELFIWEANQPEAVSRIKPTTMESSPWLGRAITLAHRPGDEPLRSGAEPSCATNGPPRRGKIRYGPRPRLHVHRNDRGQGIPYSPPEAGSSIRNVTAFDAHTGGCLRPSLPEKRTWLSSGRDGCIRAGLLQVRKPFHPRSRGAIYRIVSDGTHLWTASRDKTLKAWRLSDLAFVRKIPTAKAEHAFHQCLACRTQPQSSTLLFGGDDRGPAFHLLTDSTTVDPVLLKPSICF